MELRQFWKALSSENTMCKRIIFYSVLIFGYFISITCVSAQFFSSDTVNDSEKEKSETVGWGKFYNNSTQAERPAISWGKDVSPSSSEKLMPPAKQEVKNPEEYRYKDVPQIDRPTLDGVKRGRTSVVPVVADKNVTAEGYIYIYYSDFSVGSMMSGSTTCDVKFQILTTLDRKLNSLAIRLKWQNMDTPVTFIDVNPNQPYHMMYTLLGDGCYSMDKIPNIVVNRCRVKGMTQEECARRVRWIKKVQ